MSRKNIKITKNLMTFIPLDGQRYCVGRVFVGGEVFYIGVDSSPIERIANFKCEHFLPTIFSWTTDAEIWRKRWIVNDLYCQCDVFFPQPEYILGSGETLRVVGFLDDYVREFNPNIDIGLYHKKSRSPITIELAAKAENGLCDPQDYYDEMKHFAN